MRVEMKDNKFLIIVVVLVLILLILNKGKVEGYYNCNTETGLGGCICNSDGTVSGGNLIYSEYQPCYSIDYSNNCGSTASVSAYGVKLVGVSNESNPESSCPSGTNPIGCGDVNWVNKDPTLDFANCIVSS